MEYGFGDIVARSPYTPYSIFLRGTVRTGVTNSWIGAQDFGFRGINGFRVEGCFAQPWGYEGRDINK